MPATDQDVYCDEDKDILEPFLHITKIPGKKIRSEFAKALNLWMDIPKDKLQQIEDILETLHNASLLIDDIQDDSNMRRGIPTAHTIYGIYHTTNSANYVALLCLEKVSSLGKEEAIRIVVDRVLELYRGQGMEIYWRDNFICPSVEEYKLMCIRKTGGLFLLAVELMQLFSPIKANFTKFGELLGLFFQIRDDYMNLCSNEYAANKTFCEDISEGKFSFPIIHAIQSRPTDERVINILKKKTQDIEEKKRCLSLLRKFGSLAYTRQVLTQLKEELLKEWVNLPKNLMIEHILNNMLSFE